MTTAELELFRILLNGCSENLSNNSCNDFPELQQHMPKEELVKFVKKAYEDNGTPQDFDENHLYLPDWWVFSILKKKALKELGEMHAVHDLGR
jgi:hypothetical protein